MGLPRIIGITGLARHGKDTVAGVLARELGYSVISPADPLKAALEKIDPIVRPLVTAGPGGQGWQGYGKRLSEELRQVGWERAKECAEVRRLLQLVGTTMREVIGPDCWLEAMARSTKGFYGSDRKIVIPSIRFQNEADLVRRMHGQIWLVQRPGFDNGVPITHESESNVASLRADRVFVNEGTKAQFQDAVFRDLKFQLALVTAQAENREALDKLADA